jgi:hypothetical protein
MGEEIAASGYSNGGKVSILHLLSSARVPLAFRGPLFGLGRIHFDDEVSWLLSAHEERESNGYKKDHSKFRIRLDEQKG